MTHASQPGQRRRARATSGLSRQPTSPLGWRAGSLALLLVAAGCGDESVSVPDARPSASTPLFTTEHFSYFVEDGDASDVCDGIAEWMETYYDAYAGFFGVDLPPGERIEYHLYGSKESVQRAFGCEANACAKGTKIGAVYPFIAHEVVHAVGALHGDPPALFEEGLASVLDCAGAGDSSKIDKTVPLEELVETQAFKAWFLEYGHAALYAASKSFVRYLLDRHGTQRFLAFRAEVTRGDSRAEVASVFHASFDVSIDEAFADWRTQPPRHHGDSCLPVAECGPAIPELASGDIRLGCGTSGGENLAREALFRVQTSAGKLLHISTRPEYTDTAVSSVYELHRCDGGLVFGRAEHTAWYVGVDGTLRFDPDQLWNASAIDVPAGDYVVWFASKEDAALSLEVSERDTPMRGAECTVAEEPLLLGSDHQTTLASRWVDRTCDGPWCPGKTWDVSIGPDGGALEAQAAVVINAVGEFSPRQLYVCSEPCPGDWSSCELLDLDTETGQRVRTAQVFPPGTVLRLGAPNSLDEEHFTIRLRAATD